MPESNYWLSLTRAILAFALIPNAVFWVTSIFIPVQVRLNCDFLVVALLACFCSRAVTVSLLTFTVMAEAIAVWLYVYQIDSDQLITASRYIANVPWSRTALAIVLLLLASMTVAVATAATAGSDWKNHKRRSAWCFGILLILLYCLEVTEISITGNKDARVIHPLVTSALGHVISVGINRRSPAWHGPYNRERVESATGDFFKDAPLPGPPGSQPHNLVLILVESYGKILDKSLEAKLTAPYEDPALLKKYDASFLNIPFFGGTVPGEFRELCGLRLPLSALLDAQEFADQCLPRQLEKSGYVTTGLHGYSSHMFDRATWWKQMGFDREEFYEDLRSQPNMHVCGGPLPGICDTDMVPIIRKLLVQGDRKRPQLIYWVSLSSHFPIPISENSSGPFSCGTKPAQDLDSTICNWMGLIYKVNKAIADLAADAALPPTDFILVGDHAPPVFSLKRRAEFSYSVTPAVVLRRKDTSVQSGLRSEEKSQSRH